MIFKNSNMVIFQSPFQAKLFSLYDKDIFADGTFYIAPKISYQIFITRTYVTVTIVETKVLKFVYTQ